MHAMKADEDRFLAYAENLFKALQKMSVPEREKNEMLGRLGEARQELQSGESDESDSTPAEDSKTGVD